MRRDIHEAIGGFDETLKLAEDHDYVQRAAQYGEFGVIASVHIPVSMRRLEKEGLTKLASSICGANCTRSRASRSIRRRLSTNLACTLRVFPKRRAV